MLKLKLWLTTLIVFAVVHSAPGNEPIKLHPDNPHYFLFRGKPTVLITSAEHYGAALNLDFDYIPYLDELQARGFNLTRIFSGDYIEGEKSIVGVEGENTLAPRPGRFIAPWARSSTPGYANGGHKFDLTKFDPAYFARLKDFIAEAGKRGIVVEVTLFCVYYRDEHWMLSPLNSGNNVNSVGGVDRRNVHDLSDPALTGAQTEMVRKFVAELKDFDNLYYEVCNEPYISRVTAGWNDHIVSTIVGAEADFPNKHLIAQNFPNDSPKIESPNPAVSIFNFHYSSPPESVAMNYHLRKVIAFDESGFLGTGDNPYRMEAWDFIVAGGAVYNKLDWSFTPAHERGTFVLPPKTPGGGSPTLRGQLQILRRFIDGFDFVRMSADNAVIKSGVPAGFSARALVEPGRAYALYLRTKPVKPGDPSLMVTGKKGPDKVQANLVIELPPGSYRAGWVNTKTGKVDRAERFTHGGGNKTLGSPAFADDIALRIKAAAEPGRQR